jgi:hypothetical protein
MKLAEALILRADCQKRMEQLKQRLLRSAKVQEGNEPAEEPKALLAELEKVSAELQGLIQRINRTNSATAFGSGMVLADALAVRDVLKLKQAAYRDLAQAAVVTQDRFTKSEIKFRSTVNIAEVQKIADGLAVEHRELDARIQEANWRTELLE